MPDLQTELFKVIKVWDDNAAPQAQATQTHTQSQPQEKQMEEPKSVSEQVFEYVKAHPGFSPNTYAAHLIGTFKYNTVRTLINQMVRLGTMTKDENGRVCTAADRYMPIPNNKQLNKPSPQTKKQPKATVKVRPPKVDKATEPIKGFVSHTAATPSVAIPSTSTDKLTAEYVMDRISIVEGKKLFTLLSNVF